MQPGPYKEVPLTDDDRDLLLMVFRKRRKLLLSAFAILMFMAALCSRKIDHSSQYTGNIIRWDGKDAYNLSRLGMKLINLCFLEILLIIPCVYFWVKRVYPLKRDADSGVKEMVPYMILRKEYFPLTNQYYVALDDPKYLHHEMDEESYRQCFEGGFIYVYRGITSGFVFEESGKYFVL